MADNVLQLPSKAQKDKLATAFMKGLESYTIFDKTSNMFCPVVCCVCDSIPTKPHWSCFVDVRTAADLFEKSNMHSSLLETIYPKELLNQYSLKCNNSRNKNMRKRLGQYILSPASYINEFDEILMCKQCYSDLMETKEKYNKKRKHTYLPPIQSIANGYLVGDAPVELSCLNQVELSLVSQANIYCQSWIFFAGCHTQIKGWHTFYKNRPSDNVGNLMQLTDAGIKNIVLVVLCGPFTTTQQALVRAKTHVHPERVIAAFRWLKKHNHYYKDCEIPDVASIAMPIIIDDAV